MTRVLSLLLCPILLLGGCATRITATKTSNPPPREAFSGFTKITVGDVRYAKECARSNDNDRALAKIGENLDARLKEPRARWHAAGAGRAPQRTLVVDPLVTEMKFVDGTARFWAGAMAGSSAVVLRVRIYVYETDEQIAAPEFFARASAMGGGWTIGATDNVMLSRIADRLADYLEANYEQPVGGPTGVDVR